MLAMRLPLIALVFAAACGGNTADTVLTDAAPVDSGFAQSPDSAWVSVDGPTLVAFYPATPTDSASKELATALDDLSFHMSEAFDSLTAAGYAVQYRTGDTLWLRVGTGRARFIRAPAPAAVGYLFANASGAQAAVYGVRTSSDLIDFAREFAATGAIVER
jgi:hypothetical protein